MAFVATATTLGKNPAHGSLTRPSLVSVGTIVWLSSELMFFAALFAIYFTIRSVSTDWPPKGDVLDVKFDGAITIVLVLSSVTCQARRLRRRRASVASRRPTGASSGSGACASGSSSRFSWARSSSAGKSSSTPTTCRDHFAGTGGMTISSSAYGSIFFLATGFHALHVSGGLVAFIFLLARLSRGRFTPEKVTSTIVVSYYWHFVDVVWIGLFSMIFLIQ